MSNGTDFFFRRIIPVLDHGSVKGVESWGSEESIIEAARMSTGKGFVSWDPYPGAGNGDAGLLSYLYRHKHMTLFEMCGMVIEVKAPIFVFREWHRHRTQSYNEMSARYIPIPDEHYMPDLSRCVASTVQVAANRQAQGVSPRIPTPEDIIGWQLHLKAAYEKAEVVYKSGLELGIPKEIARLPMPVARYSKMRASSNLRNWLQFLELRQAEGAQWEIRQYADVVGSLVALLFPRTWELFRAGNK